VLSIVMLLLLAGCLGSTPTRNADGTTKQASVGDTVSSFDPKQVGKGDVDRMADVHRQEVFASVRLLAEKLYKRNPHEWRKSGYVSAELALDHLLDPRTGWRAESLGDKRGTDAIQLAFRPDFTGDRVEAFICGLGGMLNVAFDEKLEFFMTDALDPQRLYNSARNVELAAWRLATAKDAQGNLLLLSNELATATEPANLSFEREFGKMIAHLDSLSRVIAERDHRTIARVMQNVVTTIFLPVTALRSLMP
jgi:hypothetical protein